MRAGSATHLGMGGAIVGLAKRIGANCAAIAAAPRNGRSARGDAPAEVATPADGTKLVEPGADRQPQPAPILPLLRPMGSSFRFGRSECEALIAGITMGKAPPEVCDQIVSRTDGVLSSRN